MRPGWPPATGTATASRISELIILLDRGAGNEGNRSPRSRRTSQSRTMFRSVERGNVLGSVDGERLRAAIEGVRSDTTRLEENLSWRAGPAWRNGRNQIARMP